MAFKSRKSGDWLPRRRGINAIAALPLCPECHRHGKESIHAIGEKAFFEGRRDEAFRVLAQLIAETFLGETKGGL